MQTHFQIGCTFVAALLHYFFLASFCWMLCEGVMLYLMLVVVFSTMAKRWWFFLLLGWSKHYITANNFFDFSALLFTCTYKFIHNDNNQFLQTLVSFVPVTPLLPVFIGLVADHENYGVEDDKGNLL